MKSNITRLLFALAVSVLMQSCGGEIGGTETGTTSSELATRISGTADALVLAINQSNVSPQVSALQTKALIDGTTNEWATYLDPDNSYILTDVFGSPDESPAVVTKIRVLLNQLGGDLDRIFLQDTDFSCTGADALSQGDTLEIAFYGNVPNGTAGDRFFDCILLPESDSDSTMLYGEDSDGVVRVANMADITEANTEEPGARGDERRISSSVYTTYGETEENGETVAYLDLQYVQATNYNGPDDTYGSNDDVIFKSRSRITGRVVLDASGEPTTGFGEFTVTKFDSTASVESVTQTVGRGGYASEEYSLFKVDSDYSEVEDLNRTFCIQLPSLDTGLPSAVDGSNCTALETGFAWGNATFPFTLSPDKEATFDDIAFFGANDTDLISDTRDNFEIPAY